MVDIVRSARSQRALWIASAVVAAVLLFNLSVWVPAATALGHDPRNSDAVSVHVYRSWLVHPRDITIDLTEVKAAAPIDLTRALFQVAASLKDRRFGRVTLARRGRAVFRMSGERFAALGAAYENGENPIYLIRTLPESLERPDGQPAFGTWTGGWLGVLSHQMDDANAFGQAWASGAPPAAIY